MKISKLVCVYVCAVSCLPLVAAETIALTAEQKAFLAMSPAERREKFTNETYRSGLAVPKWDEMQWCNVESGNGSRWRRLPGVPNLRDLGGLVGLDGRVVNTGLVYRSGGYNDNAKFKLIDDENNLGKKRRQYYGRGKDRLTDETRKFQIERFGIKTDIDLRADGECNEMTGSPLGPHVTWVHVPALSYAAFHSEAGREAVKKIFPFFLEVKNYPIGFHCIAGADRTGSLAYLLEALLGVSDEDLCLDWELTAFHNPNHGFAHASRYDRLVAGFAKYPGTTTCEKAEGYVKSLGFTDKDIQAFRDIMLKPVRFTSDGHGPQDYTKDVGFIAAYSAAACSIAQRKIDDMEHPGRSRRLATGGHFDGYFLWDTAFCVMWARHVADDFPVAESLDNFYRFAEPDGFIGRQFDAEGRPVWNPNCPTAFAPPLLAWAELEYFRTCATGDVARLSRVYPALARHHRALKRFQRDDGLYFSDAYGCGMDELPRYPYGTSDEDKMKGGIPLDVDSVMPYARERRWERLQTMLPHLSWNKQIGWIDMSCQVALDAYVLSQIAELLDKGEEALAWREEHAALKVTINRLCWNEDLGFYCDCHEEETIPRRHAGGFWALISRVATPERAKRIVSAFQDPKVFGRPVPLPCLPADDPDYGPETGYWCGVVWPPTNYVAIRGLMAYGYKDIAEDIARRWYNACASMWVRYKTIFENQSPEQWTERRKKADVDFCGWGAIPAVALPREFGWMEMHDGYTTHRNNADSASN